MKSLLNVKERINQIKSNLKDHSVNMVSALVFSEDVRSFLYTILSLVNWASLILSLMLIFIGSHIKEKLSGFSNLEDYDGKSLPNLIMIVGLIASLCHICGGFLAMLVSNVLKRASYTSWNYCYLFSSVANNMLMFCAGVMCFTHINTLDDSIHENMDKMHTSVSINMLKMAYACTEHDIYSSWFHFPWNSCTAKNFESNCLQQHRLLDPHVHSYNPRTDEVRCQEKLQHFYANLLKNSGFIIFAIYLYHTCLITIGYLVHTSVDPPPKPPKLETPEEIDNKTDSSLASKPKSYTTAQFNHGKSTLEASNFQIFQPGDSKDEMLQKVTSMFNKSNLRQHKSGDSNEAELDSKQSACGETKLGIIDKFGDSVEFNDIPNTIGAPDCGIQKPGECNREIYNEEWPKLPEVVHRIHKPGSSNHKERCKPPSLNQYELNFEASALHERTPEIQKCEVSNTETANRIAKFEECIKGSNKSRDLNSMTYDVEEARALQFRMDEPNNILSNSGDPTQGMQNPGNLTYDVNAPSEGAHVPNKPEAKISLSDILVTPEISDKDAQSITEGLSDTCSDSEDSEGEHFLGQRYNQFRFPRQVHKNTRRRVFSKFEPQ